MTLNLTHQPKYDFSVPLTPALKAKLERLLQTIWEKNILPRLSHVLPEYENALKKAGKSDTEAAATVTSLFAMYLDQYAASCRGVGACFYFPFPVAIQAEVMANVEAMLLKEWEPFFVKLFQRLAEREKFLVAQNTPRENIEWDLIRLLATEIGKHATILRHVAPSFVVRELLALVYEKAFAEKMRASITCELWCLEAMGPLYATLTVLVEQHAPESDIVAAIAPFTLQGCKRSQAELDRMQEWVAKAQHLAEAAEQRAATAEQRVLELKQRVVALSQPLQQPPQHASSVPGRPPRAS